jgi:peptide/nickel transport system ATP-binding protein
MSTLWSAKDTRRSTPARSETGGTLLVVESLSVEFGGATPTQPVRGVSLSVARGETLCIVGESGCGKSLTALGIMDLLPRGASRRAERIDIDGIDALRIGERRMSALRGDRVAMIFQEPMTSLNPTYTIGNQLEEALLRHRRVGRRAARERAAALLAKVGIAAPETRLRQFPHQLSGGLRQRVMIAMALMCEPDLIIADEPTTALDVTIQAQILRLLGDLQHEMGLGLILITHDLGVVARIADRVMVMYAGEVVETGSVDEVFAAPAHPYTQALLRCLPSGERSPGKRLCTIPGMVPQLTADRVGCGFRERCAHAVPECAAAVPLRVLGERRTMRCVLPALRPLPEVPLAAAGAARRAVPPVSDAPTSDAPLLEARNVICRFSVSGGWLAPPRELRAVDGVSLHLARGEVLGLVGESGCGKSTLAKLLIGLQRPNSGEILIDGEPIAASGRLRLARRIQPVFQDPYSALNPRKTVGSIITLPLRVHSDGELAGWRRRVEEMMALVGLPRRLYDALPHEMSGGQRQRVAIARALILRPKIVICDEPTSALDVSVQAQILNLLLDLRVELGLTYLLISHNLGVVEHMANRVAVMYLGRIVEEGPTAALFAAPQHPYTRVLLASMLSPEPRKGLPDLGLGTAAPDPLAVPAGCRFHPRCSARLAQCANEPPRPIAVAAGHVAECHLHGETLAMAASSTYETARKVAL